MLLCLSLLSLPSVAQTAPAVGPVAAPPKSIGAQIHPVTKGGADYSKEPYVVLKNIQRIRFAADGTRVRDIQFAARIQSDAMVRQFGVLHFNYASDYERVDVDNATGVYSIPEPSSFVYPSTTHLLQKMG